MSLHDPLPEAAPALASAENEAALLGAMMLTNGIIDRVADLLTAEDFAEPINARIFSAILRDHSLGKPANCVTLSPYFADDPAMKDVGQGYLVTLTSSDAVVFGWQGFAETIRDLSRRRKLVEGLNAAIDDANDWNIPVEDVMASAETAITAASDEDRAGTDFTAAELVGDVLDSFSADSAPPITCRVQCINETMGPIEHSNLVILAGRPGMGKTAVALNYGIGAAMNGHGVLFISAEMSKRELAQRMIADLSFNGQHGIPLTAIQKRDVSGPQQQDLIRLQDRLQSVPFRIADVSSPTASRVSLLIRRHARRMAAAGHKLELVIVDYLGLVRADRKTASRYEEITLVSNGLKAAAKEYGVAVMALAQLSRDVEKRPDKRPQLSDLRDSGSIEQDADTVMFLLRPEYYLKQAEPTPDHSDYAAWQAAMAEKRGQLEFIVAKRRHGVTGTAMGEFHGAYQAVRG